MTFSLSALRINFFSSYSLLKRKADDKCRLKFVTERVKLDIKDIKLLEGVRDIAFFIILSEQIKKKQNCFFFFVVFFLFLFFFFFFVFCFFDFTKTRLFKYVENFTTKKKMKIFR